MSTEAFPDWLKRQLIRREWSQADLARKLDIGSGMVSRWARGERVPSSDSCERIAEALGVDADYVLALAGHRPAIHEDDPTTAAIVSLVRKIKWTEDRNPIRSMLEQLAEYDRRTRGAKSQ